MIYAQFYRDSVNGKSNPVLGSDGVMIMDGRWSKQTCCQAARKQAAMLNANLNKGITGFTLEHGPSFSNSSQLMGWMAINS